jgi:hypothetical protein
VESFGINFGLLFRLLFTLALPLVWLLLSLLALLALRGRGLTGSTLAIWVLIIVAVPFLGALAVWIVQPVERPRGERAGLREA